MFKGRGVKKVENHSAGKNLLESSDFADVN